MGNGRRDYTLAAYCTFFVGEGDDREIAGWWLFYPNWEDPKWYFADLRQKSGRGTVTFNDGYVVAVSPNATDEVRRAAAATPDTDYLGGRLHAVVG